LFFVNQLEYIKISHLLKFSQIKILSTLSSIGIEFCVLLFSLTNNALFSMIELKFKFSNLVY